MCVYLVAFFFLYPSVWPSCTKVNGYILKAWVRNLSRDVGRIVCV